MDKVKCPECGKELTPQGLSGHRRFVHGSQATGKQQEEPLLLLARRVAELQKQVAELQARKQIQATAPATHPCPLCGSPVAPEQAKEAERVLSSLGKLAEVADSAVELSRGLAQLLSAWAPRIKKLEKIEQLEQRWPLLQHVVETELQGQ
jgi:DNA repair exonuclease SbcCD ATPase subunit